MNALWFYWFYTNHVVLHDWTTTKNRKGIFLCHFVFRFIFSLFIFQSLSIWLLRFLFLCSIFDFFLLLLDDAVNLTTIHKDREFVKKALLLEV